MYIYTWEKNSCYHSWENDDEEGKDLEVACQHTASLSIDVVLTS